MLPRELVTDLLDVTGLLLVAAGAGFGAGLVIGWAGLGVSGFVVMAGSWLSTRAGRAGGQK